MAKRTGQPGIPAGIRIKSGARAGFVAYPLGLETSLGRLKTVDVFLPDLKSSRQHCMILWDRGHWLLMDLSSNGTYLNGQRVERATDISLKNNDVIRIGETEIEFRLAQAIQPTGAPSAPTPTPRPSAATAPPPRAPAPAPGFFPTESAQTPAWTPSSPAPVTASAEVDYEFDFDEDTSPSLDKVFEDFSGKGKDFTSTTTQALDARKLRERFDQGK